MDIEDDDEFGDLYSDVLRPIPVGAAPPASPPAAAPSKPPADPVIDVGDDVADDDDDDAILFGSSNKDSHPLPARTLAHSAATGDADYDWMLGGAPPAVEEPASWDDEDEVIPSKIREIPGLNLALINENSEISKEDPVIPGLAAVPVRDVGETRTSRSDEWDSDNEDDLQIVLNDAHHGPMGAQMNINEQNDEEEDDEDDDDGDDFVIVANKDQQHHHHAVMEVEEWGEEATQMGDDGETKEAVETGKGGVVAAGVVGPRIGYSSHGFHPQHHSMYKYVRPGAAPVGGATTAASVGALGQIRPLVPMAPLAGRGRGDWRPAMGRGVSAAQKSFHPGSGLAAWGGQANRVFGIGLDFTLPSHKTVFDVDIDSFEEKPWKLPGVDISDFFNFALDEDKWKEYCKQLEQLRLESTMQSKIRVYESGRSERDYDPDLPPELAAAAGLNDIAMEHLGGRSDVGQADLIGQGRGVSRPLMPTGRAIQVESGYGERLPSIDTRAPRIRDSDAIIEIVCQDFVDDSTVAVGQPGSELDREPIKGGHEADGDIGPLRKLENNDSLSQTVSARGRGSSSRRAVYTPEVDDNISSFTPEAALQSHSYTKSHGHERRRPPWSPKGRYPSPSADHSIDVIASQSEHMKGHDGDHEEKSEGSMDALDTPAPASPVVGVVSASDLVLEQIDDDCDNHDEKLALGDSIEVKEEEVASDSPISLGTAGDDSLEQSSKKQKLRSRVEQPIIDNHSKGEELKARQSDSVRVKRGSENENRKGHVSGREETSAGKSKRGGELRKHHEEDENKYRINHDYGRDERQETEKRRAPSKGHVDAYHSYPHREDIRQDRGDDLGLRHRSKNRTGEWKDSDDDMHSKKRVNDIDYRTRDREGASRQRERADALVIRRDELSDPLTRRRREDEHIRREKVEKEDALHGHRLRDDSSKRKRERERVDGLDRRRREDTRARDKPDDRHSSRHKDDNWFQKGREDRQRLKEPQEDVQKHQDREGRGALRNGRVVDDKNITENGKSRNESKRSGLIDNQHKDRRRKNENSRGGDQDGEGKSSHRKGREDINIYDNRVSEERISRREMSTSHNDHLSNTYLNQHINQDRHRENTRQNSECEPREENFQCQNKRKHEDHVAQRSELILVNKNSRSEPESRSNGPNLTHEQADALPQRQHSLLVQGEEVASDDEYSDSRRGRSKLERWTSHMERDYSAVDNRGSFSSSSRVKVSSATNDLVKEQSGELGKGDAHIIGELEAKDFDVGQIPEKKEDLDKHLETVAKLTRRSERFNLPIPGEKDVNGSKTIHNELPAQSEAHSDTDVKTERTARKHKWTSG